MRAGTVVSIGLALVIATGAACDGGSSDRHEYALEGQILSFAADHKEATIKHGTGIFSERSHKAFSRVR